MTFINPNAAIIAGEAVKAAKSEGRQGREKKVTEKTVQLGHDYAQVVQKAQKENSDNHPEMVQQARELLSKGHFDTREAAQEAAQKMVDYGI
jgi:hypothetical protein